LPPAVFFDLDETLIEHRIDGAELIRRIYAAHREALDGVSEAEFRTMLRQNAAALWGTMFEPAEPGIDPLERSFRRTLEALGRDVVAAHSMRDSFVDIVLAETHPSAGAKEVLARLRADGVATGIITNGYIAFQERKIAHHGFTGLTDFVLVSEAAGAHKPDPRIFQLALKRANVAPEDAWHVGDHLVNDIGGAEGARLHSVLYDPHGDRLPKEGAWPSGSRQPSHVIQRLAELPGLVLAERAPR
jgi:putative hydrolase of the HAD superfamily